MHHQLFPALHPWCTYERYPEHFFFFFFLTLYGDEAAIINPSLKDQTKASKDEKELTEALFPIALAEAEF